VRRSLFFVDHISAWAGKMFAWCIVILTFVVGYDVMMRYIFRSPTTWAFDVSYILYGTLFMMAGAYTLSRNGHVRGDMFYRSWSVRTQATVDLVLYLLFFFPGVIALVWSGWQFAELSRALNERSSSSPQGPIIWPYKYVIPISALFMLMQGIVETIRCVQAIRTGEWPERLSDVEETETRLAKESQM
jgi:TRAP-type mannitol/chloroaromatic compound transport system permease small subunit